MPSLPCTRCGTLLEEPAYYRLTTAELPDHHSLVNNVLWLCHTCYAAVPPDERAIWLARRAAPAEEVKPKGKLRSLLDSLLGRSPHR
ncbi:MAG TPA: hypothetical protein VMU50_01925 [Polyangia bacterium]|nr:hypothetical protein [Polyangia bacterium]